MTVHAGLLRLSTEGNGDVVDLTEGVRRVLQQAGADRGVVTVFVTGSTAAVTTIEYEPGAVQDLKDGLERLLPHLHGEFDPGSGRTLAARLTHASRARTRLRGWGKRRTGE
jgi:thiamine phosphate synthase YjbQ (UPF0047 family)